MSEINLRHAAISENQQRQDFCTSNGSQRARMVEWLSRGKPLSTLQARKELDILHPAARVLELRKLGFKIFTHWTNEDNGKGKHRVANYVLLS
jgi:hypothetical protein